jgi:hypothetical protein
MKLLVASYRRCAGEIMAEAAIGLSLMAFVWMILVYSLYLADNQIRTEMAARYAAWYQGNNIGNNNNAPPNASDIDKYFFFQSGLSVVKTTPGFDMVAALGKEPPGSFATTNGISSPIGPFLVQVTFGVSSLDNNTNPFPFNLLNPSVQVPFMPTNLVSVCSVSSTCQWDGDSDNWSNWGDAAKGVWNMLSSNVKSLFSL